METYTLSPGRSWIIRALTGNPLVRATDRLEALVLILAFAVVLAAVPVAGAVGTAVHEGRARVLVAEAQSRHVVAATLIEDSAVEISRQNAVGTALSRWRVDGVEHVDEITVDPATKAGDQVDIWVDRRGDQVAPPMPTWWAGVEAVVTGIALWLGVTAGVAGLATWARTSINRQRYLGWDREWQTLSEDSGGRTGSQP